MCNIDQLDRSHDPAERGYKREGREEEFVARPDGVYLAGPAYLVGGRGEARRGNSACMSDYQAISMSGSQDG